MIRSLKIYEFFVTITRKLGDRALSGVALNYCLLLQANCRMFIKPD